jgi:serine/threonine-protein kinase
MAFDQGVPPDAVRLYLEASALREGPLTTERAVTLLAKAVAIDPRFAPALSALALRSLTAWFVPFVYTGPEWKALCAERVARALEHAGSLAETHVAAAVFHLEQGSPREAEVALRRALQLAPTCVEALSVLGQIACETGQTAAGRAHLRLASELDPAAVMPAVYLAREEAYAGRLEACFAILDALGDDAWSPPAYLVRIRAAAWHGEADVVRSWVSRGAGMGDASGQLLYGELVARALLGEAARDDLGAMADGLLAAGNSPRFQAESQRIAAEVEAMNGWPERALARIQWLGELPAFIDVGWLEKCPVLRPLAGDATFAAVLAKTRARAHASR